MGALTKVDDSLLITRADEEALFAAVAEGNLAKLTKPQQLSYYKKRCDDLGLNPLNQPFSWLTLNGKLVLYANRACTEELRSTRNISLTITRREMIADCYVVTAQAKLPDGRTDESTGAVPIPETYKGEIRANSMMKAETKAKRRVTLSICGLGYLDESEVATIPEVIKRAEKASQAEYEAQHAAVLEKAETQQIIEAQNASENDSQEPVAQEPVIDDTTRRKLFAACKQKGISHEDLKRYLLEMHNVTSSKDITAPIFKDVIAWLESVQ